MSKNVHLLFSLSLSFSFLSDNFARKEATGGLPHCHAMRNSTHTRFENNRYNKYIVAELKRGTRLTWLKVKKCKSVRFPTDFTLSLFSLETKTYIHGSGDVLTCNSSAAYVVRAHEYQFEEWRLELKLNPI